MEVFSNHLIFKDRLEIQPMGDLHLGARGCDERRIKRDIDWVLEGEDRYVIGIGDYVDAVLRQDAKRFTGDAPKAELLDMLDSMLNEQRDLAIRTLRPLADAGRLLGLVEGNHEETIKKHHSYDIMRDICKELQVPYLGYSCFYRLTTQKEGDNTKRNVTFYIHHGHGGGRKGGASVNRLEDLTAQYDADIYLMGHNHHKHGSPYTRLSISQSGTAKLHHKTVILGRTGTYLRTCEQGNLGYGEKAGYPPTDIGSIRINIGIGGKHHDLDMHVSV